MDQEMLQIKFDHLLSAKYIRSPLKAYSGDTDHQVGSRKHRLASIIISGEKIPFCLVNAQYSVVKKIHGIVMTLKRNDDQIRCDAVQSH